MMKRYVLILIAFMWGLTAATPTFSVQSDSGMPVALTWSIAPQAYAQNTPSSDTCTSDWRGAGAAGDQNDQDAGKAQGLLTQIVNYMTEVIDATSQALYEGITDHSAFTSAISAAFSLFVIFFAVAFMFGIVPLTFGQALTRLLKMAFIIALISPTGWEFFNDYAVEFFNDGTNELIDSVIQIATGDILPPSQTCSFANGALQVTSVIPIGGDCHINPFARIERSVGAALSPEMMVATLTAFTTGPMGPAMGGLMGIGLVAFVQVLIKALRVYCISLIAKALLFGLAPIFVSFILFERTKHIFTGWVNQLVNYSLQPIMLFAFLAFFVVLIESAIDNILGADICWSTTELLSGAETQSMYWRFTDENGNPSTSDFTWDGLVSCIQAGTGTCDDFPISILDILTFLILSHLAYRFSDVVVNIATEIASSTLFLDKLRSGLAEFIQQPGSVRGDRGGGGHG